MRPRVWLMIAALVLVVGVVLATLAVLVVTAAPLALVIGAAVVALVAGVDTRLGHRWRWRRGRRAPVAPDVGYGDPASGVDTDGLRGEQRLRWSTGWESDLPVHAVPRTRQQVTAVLAEWGLTGEPVEPTLLVVTELLSNTIDHARGPVRVSIELFVDTVHVEVADATPDPPQLQPPDPARARGRGVHLVETLSLRWGWTPGSLGKVVWADVPTEWLT